MSADLRTGSGLLRKKKCKKVIPFDECFITKVGEAPDEIKANSVCGQYLKNHPMTDEDITEMALKASLQPLPDSSRYDGRRKYQLGRVLVSDDYLLMAFAKLDIKCCSTYIRNALPLL